MKPINYYIQLPSLLSEKIDSLSYDELVQVAYKLLVMSKNIKSRGFDEFVPTLECAEFSITHKQAVSLAHGCLAKATAMSEV